jgi:hypothetical protein
MKIGKKAGEVGGGALAALVLVALWIWGMYENAKPPRQQRSAKSRGFRDRLKLHRR